MIIGLNRIYFLLFLFYYYEFNVVLSYFLAQEFVSDFFKYL